MTFRAASSWVASVVVPAMLAAGQAASPALAQPDDAFDQLMNSLQPELYCVFDVLKQSGDFYDIADAWVDPDASEAVIADADAVLSDAVDQCATAYDWDEATQEFGALVGIHGSVVEVLTSDMTLEGLEEGQVEAVFDLLDTMSDEETTAFVGAGWMGDHGLRKKIYRRLVRAGLPNEDHVLENAMYVLESSVLAADTIVQWMDVRIGAGAPTASPTPTTPPASPPLREPKANKATRTTPRAPKLDLAGTGTGWYVAPDGYLVTNAHVVDSCKMVTLKSGAELVVLDIAAGEDLALLKGLSTVNHLALRDGRSARLAEDVLIAGYPLGGILSSGINVTVGTVSALAGMGDDTRRFQFTAPVQPGNSGGPVLDTSGNVIGVVVSKLNAMSVQAQTGDIPQNVNFGIALPNLAAFLKKNDVPFEQRPSNAPKDKVDLAELARESTVLLQCYQ